MRDFKFRVWCRGWKPPRYANNDELHITQGRFSDIIKNFFNVDLYVLEQFTGLKDRNNKDVYEGDLARVLQSPKYEKGKVTHYEDYFIGKVLFRNGSYWIEGRKKGASLCISMAITIWQRLKCLETFTKTLTICRNGNEIFESRNQTQVKC